MKLQGQWRVCTALLVCGLSRPALAGDTLLIHGHIYTGNAAAPWAAALSVQGSRIEAVGTDAAILKHRGRRAHVIDLHGQTVIPGIVDSHMHLLYGAYALHGMNLSTPQSSITPDKADLFIERLKTYAAAHPADAVLFGRADFSTVPPTTPTHALLDRAVAERPVVIHNTSEHALWLNAAALAMAGITDRPVAQDDEERGVIRDASGHPSGVLLEAAMQLAARAVAVRVPLEERLAMLQAATRYLNSFGITSVVNATGDLAEIGLYGTLRDRGVLTVRTRTSFGSVAVQHHLTPGFLADLEQARRLHHDEWVSANLVKFFADGSTGLIPPLVYAARDYEALVMELDARGYQIMTHALRADSVHMILDTYERLEQAHGARDRRLRIEHADLIDAQDLPRFARLAVIAGMQPSFCCGEDGGNFDPAEAIPSDRWHTLEQSGAVLAFSSDWPCTWPPDPFVSIQQSATRQVWKSADTAGVAGTPLDGAAQGGAVVTGAVYVPDERISVLDAVRAYTQGSAYAAFSDREVGTLEAGKLADLAVLSQDIFSVPPESIGQTRVLTTMVGGKIVYAAAGASPAPASDIPAADLIQPADLAAALQSAASKPVILQVGFRTLFDQAHIPGAEYAGAAGDPEGLHALRERAGRLPRDTAIVIYCGCCPWSHCPNVAAAFAALRELGFTRLKVLYIRDNFGSDWVDKGFPVDKAPSATDNAGS